MKKFLILMLAAVFTVSCNSDDGSSSGGGNSTPSPMTAKIDGQTYSMQPEQGGNYSDPTGDLFGPDFHMLEGYKVINVIGALTGREPLVPHDYFIRLAIPKINVTPGTYTFTETQLPNGYFADLEIFSDSGDGEDEVIAGGEITVVSYDATTKRLKGTFEFTTNNGTSTVQTHTVSGSFNYILMQE